MGAYRGCDSCWGNDACFKTNNINVGTSSCHGIKACAYVKSDSTIGNDSCHGDYSCEYVKNKKIGNNSCNGYKNCKECKHNVPDNACNTGITDDMDIHGYCNYCL